MDIKTDVNARQRPTVGARYPQDRIALLDAVKARRGDKDRAATICHAMDVLIELHFPGALDSAA